MRMMSRLHLYDFILVLCLHIYSILYLYIIYKVYICIIYIHIDPVFKVFLNEGFKFLLKYWKEMTSDNKFWKVSLCVLLV